MPFLDNAEKNNFRNKTLNDISCSGTPNFYNVIPVCDRHVKASEDVFEKRTVLNSVGH